MLPFLRHLQCPVPAPPPPPAAPAPPPPPAAAAPPPPPASGATTTACFPCTTATAGSGTCAASAGCASLHRQRRRRRLTPAPPEPVPEKVEAEAQDEEGASASRPRRTPEAPELRTSRTSGATALAGGEDEDAEPTEEPDPEPVAVEDVMDDAAVDIEARLRQELHDRLIRVLDLRTLEMEALEEEALRERSRDAIVAIIDEMDAAGEWDETLDRDRIIRDVLDEVHGLGPLEEFLADDSITEVMVNHPRQIYVERNGRLERAHRIFSSDRAVMQAIERIVAPLGRRIDQSSPMVDARLQDGSRVNAIIPPLAIRGPSITIRKFAKERMTVEDLIRLNTLNKEMAEFLRQAVLNRRNVVISGGTGSGKTTTLNILSSYIPASERIVTIEDAAELTVATRSCGFAGVATT